MANEQSATDGAHSTAQRHSGGAELVAKAWVLLDELDNVRSAPPGEGDWRALNKADDELRVALDGIEAEPAHASEYPPLPKPALPRGGFPDLFDADQMRTYVDADRAMRAAQPEGAQQPGTAYAVLPEIDRVIGRLASSDPDFPDCEDAVVLLRKYRKLCQEIGRGDSHHLDRIEKAAIAVESRAPHGQAPAQAEPAISAGDAVFAFASMLTALPHVIPFGAAAWATPGVELATAFNAANGFSVSQNFPDGLVFPKITGDLLAVVETAAAPVAQGDALTPGDADQLEKAITDFEECGETDVPDETLQRFAAMGYLECVHYNVLPVAHEAIDAARAQAKEGGAA